MVHSIFQRFFMGHKGSSEVTPEQDSVEEVLRSDETVMWVITRHDGSQKLVVGHRTSTTIREMSHQVKLEHTIAIMTTRCIDLSLQIQRGVKTTKTFQGDQDISLVLMAVSYNLAQCIAIHENLYGDTTGQTGSGRRSTVRISVD